MFNKNRQNYPVLYKSNFGEKQKDIIIYKKLEIKEPKYEMIDELIIHKNSLSNMDTINNLLGIKTLKL